MRIRKAEKLFSWASEYRKATSLPAPSDSTAGHLCEMNRSSWVDDLINYRREDLETANESSEIGVAGDDFKAKEKEEEAAVKEELVDKAEEKETEATGVMKCKKTDGKRWHCKRAAKLPHSLCSYHLTQLRSYRARFEDQVSGDHRKKPSLAVDSGGAASNYYYYYSILGPWWGKRRGPIHGDEGGSTGCNESSESESYPQDSNGKTDHEGVGVDEEEDGSKSLCQEKYNNKKKRVIKRRGRKPVKSRSLKSLL